MNGNVEVSVLKLGFGNGSKCPVCGRKTRYHSGRKTELCQSCNGRFHALIMGNSHKKPKS